MKIVLGILGIVLCIVVPVMLTLIAVYKIGYRRGRDDGIADLVDKVNEGKVEFTYVDIVPRKAPRPL